MSKYTIEVKQLFEPFVYETTVGIIQVYKTKEHKCPTDTVDVLQWGDVTWKSMEGMFFGCDGITTFSATDTPDLSQCTDMSYMFESAVYFNHDISGWDVSNVTDMYAMFRFTKNFNQDIGDWDVNSVTDMTTMFSGAEKFNQDISNWDVSSVTDVGGMFLGCPIQEIFKPKFKF